MVKKIRLKWPWTVYKGTRLIGNRIGWCGRIVFLFWLCLQFMVGPVNYVHADEEISGIITASTPAMIVFVISISVLKMTAFVLGYLIVKLGHDTMIKGVTGEFDFGFSGSGVSTKLKAASPGVFFVLMGSAIIIWGLTVKKPMEITYSPSDENVTSTSTETNNESSKNIKVPD